MTEIFNQIQHKDNHLQKNSLIKQKSINLKSNIGKNSESELFQENDEFSLIKNKKNFTVAVRIKPELNSSQNDCIPMTINKFINSEQLKIGSINKSDYHSYIQNNNKKFTFDKVFETSAKNKDIFDSLIHQNLKLLQKGINLSIMAYGATNSGKTYTIFGRNTDFIQIQGIASMTFGRVFQMLVNQHSMTFSFVQIYNQSIYDLLNSNSNCRPLNILQDSQGNTNIIGLNKVELESISQIQQLIFQGNNARISNSNIHNVHSSRSHALMQLEIKDNTTHQKTKLVMVDLAGSQKYIYNSSLMPANGSNLLKQGSNINKSLLSLGNCIKSLHMNENHIPYRDSKLTRLLKENLHGYAHNIMITCIGQKSSNIEENINSLNYAIKAMKIYKKIQRKIQSEELSEYQCTHCQQKLPFFLIKDINKHYQHNRRVKTKDSSSLSISPISKTKDKQNYHFFKSNQAETSKNFHNFVSYTNTIIDHKFDGIFRKIVDIQYTSMNKLTQLLIRQKQSIKNEIKQKFMPSNSSNISPFSIGNQAIQNNSGLVSQFQQTVHSINLSSEAFQINKNTIKNQKRVKISLAKPNKRLQRTASTADRQQNLLIKNQKQISDKITNHIRIEEDISQSVSEIHSFRSNFNLTVNILDDKQKLMNERKEVLEQITYNHRNKQKDLGQFKSRQNSLKCKVIADNYLSENKSFLTINQQNTRTGQFDMWNLGSHLLDSTSIAPRMKRDEEDNIKLAWQSIVIKNIQSPDRNNICNTPSSSESIVEKSLKITEPHIQKHLPKVFRY